MSAKERFFDLESAIAAAVRAQDDDAAWDAVESLADTLDSPDEVAAAYQACCAPTSTTSAPS